MSTVENLCIVDEGLIHDITSLFLHLKPENREAFCDVVDMVSGLAETSNSDEGVSIHDSFEVSLFARQRLGDLYDDLYVQGAVFYLKHYPAHVLRMASSEMRAINDGEIQLTPYQRKAMSNLSNMGRRTYEAVLGIDAETIPVPILDIGTGEEAMFAQELLRVRPDASVWSTSVHLGSKKSRMRSIVKGVDNPGYLVAADGAQLPFKSDIFKTVVSVNAAPYYVPKHEVPYFLNEVFRVLAPLGATAILSPALCDYGNTELTQNDLGSFDFQVDLRDMPEAGHGSYRPDVPKKIIVINK